MKRLEHMHDCEVSIGYKVDAMWLVSPAYVQLSKCDVLVSTLLSDTHAHAEL